MSVLCYQSLKLLIEYETTAENTEQVEDKDIV